MNICTELLIQLYFLLWEVVKKTFEKDDLTGK